MFFGVDQHLPSLRDSGSLGLHAHHGFAPMAIA